VDPGTKTGFVGLPPGWEDALKSANISKEEVGTPHPKRARREAWNPKRETRNPKLETLHPKRLCDATHNLQNHHHLLFFFITFKPRVECYTTYMSRKYQHHHHQVAAHGDAIIDVLRFHMEKGSEPELPSAKQVFPKLTGYSQVDMLGPRYNPVSFAAGQSPGVELVSDDWTPFFPKTSKLPILISQLV